MTRLMGSAPGMAGGATPGLPGGGAPHVYHAGAEDFFLGRAAALGLSTDQQNQLAALRERALLAFATTQRQLDQAEQDLWVLTSAERPDAAKVEAKLSEISRLSARQRMDYIRAVGDAVGILSDAQRKAVVAGNAGAAMPPASSAMGAMGGPSMPPASGAMGGPSMGGMGSMKGMDSMMKGMGSMPASPNTSGTASAASTSMPGMATPPAGSASGGMSGMGHM
ncbi:periplasmic heavy metal sensor [Sorangium sp. So ce1182]|uniref:periplasmic heavy metal sensor n=1 Tax=Sorangium sp. So ce1182 TaxID=3133334 RepID=UPI003F5E3D9F